MTPREAIEHLIRDSIEVGYRSAKLGAPSLEEVQDGFLSHPLADEGIARAIAAIRQVGRS